MTTPNSLEQDLDFVRKAVVRSAPPAHIRSIYLFWAAAVLIGMPLGDFRPEWMPRFWMTVGPGGWLISGLLGYRHAKLHGQQDRAYGYRQAAHWGAMVLIISLVALLPYKGIIAWEAMGPIVLLLLALTYCLAAIHFGRILLVPALMFAIGYGTLLFSPPYPWTIVGLLGGLGLLFSAFADASMKEAHRSPVVDQDTDAGNA